MDKVTLENLKTGEKKERVLKDFEKTCAVRGCQRRVTHFLEKGDPRVIHRIELAYCEEHWKGAMSFYCAEHPFSDVADDMKVNMLKPEVLEHIYRFKEYVFIIDMTTNKVVDMVPYWEYNPDVYYERPVEE